MDQFARASGVDPSDDPASLAVEVGEPAHPVALEDPVERRCRHVESRGQAGRPELVTPPQFDDPALHAVRRLGRTPVRSAGAILETGHPGVLIAPPPLVGGLAGNPHGLSRGRNRPTLLDHVAEAESAFWSQWSITVHREPPWGCVGV